ncbi:phenazine biosynthesis protein PhzF [Streptomyces alfalfae]|uniref:Phenazine biosynthesis protein PhzF n=1 Tax=Streptomyces alfalfae TaxID=1642299 RepID=A0A1P8TLY6_9ACTN|nr:PhzF family phenazine biosynthesis isomerase [Streptomyces alfalfae]AYA19013.1 PhzF family phenazine biosynthesis isomerase [Streptomyces fradiae]APY88599.1 phenazine biosynthesis protein PhzF [Streptomyces alfalfae]QQC89011.1 PhzF family phenazine biosynthesis isomerase [Streptomyces alfalfae]RXX36486.1 phenazine biosynthesis protein PhzF [Streptomyces alfalfae]RZM90389.1 PhzF family phenazine biosynthesis isomerase [Streptomyces alfalfae]
MTTNDTAGSPAPEVLRYAAFTTDPAGGNPAGVVLDAAGLDDTAMLTIAARLGYSETAFLTARDPGAAEPVYDVRYFAPKAEVPFCGHATVAAAVALAERDGTRAGAGGYLFATPAGEVPVAVDTGEGTPRATLTSVVPHVEAAGADDVAEALAALGWSAAELDAALPPRIAFAGARHLVIAAATRDRLARLDYDFPRLEALMRRLGLTTVQLVRRASADVFHVRDPFPVGGVVEDPATGAAAAAFGAYARELGLVPASAVLTLHQGEDMGRPGVLTVTLREGDERVRVSGTAVRIPA